MARIFGKTSSIKLPQRKGEAKHEQYGKELGGITACPNCGNVFYKKKWHASLDTLKKKLGVRRLTADRRALCPACKMLRDHLFEGEVVVEYFPQKLIPELKRVVENYGKRAKDMDPQNRILGIETGKDTMRATTTENQMAIKIAKKIEDVFTYVKVIFAHSKEPYEVERAYVSFIDK